MNEVIRYTITAKGITQTGEVTMDKDKTLDITMNLPLDVNIEIVEPGWGTATDEGSENRNHAYCYSERGIYV